MAPPCATPTHSPRNPRDADCHIALMQQIAQARPDRRIDVHRRIPGACGEAVQATWSGTPADGGPTLHFDCVFVFDVDEAGLVTRARGYYQLPG
jgi:hypothetical protein